MRGVDRLCLLKNGKDQLQDDWDDLFGRRAVGSAEPLLYSAVDGPAGSGGDHRGREPGDEPILRHAFHQDSADRGSDGGFNERFKGTLTLTFGAAGMGLGEVVAGGEDDGAGRGGTGSVVTDAALMKQHVETAGDHGVQKGEFVGVMVVERGAIDGGHVRDVLYGDLLEALSLHEVPQGTLKKLPGAPDAWIANFTVGGRHDSSY